MHHQDEGAPGKRTISVIESELPVGLYKILFYFEACVHESIILFANNAFVWAPRFPPLSHTLLRNILFPLDHP